MFLHLYEPNQALPRGGGTMATKQLLLPMQLVKKSNALCRARWSAYSVWEPRLMALLASKVRADDTDFHSYEIPVSELLQGAHSGRDYKEIADIVDNIMGRVLTIKDEIGQGWTKYTVFSRCRYRPDDRILELRFDPDLKVHYLNLQKNFAKWNLIEFLLLPSIYSQRIFEILKSWDDKPEVSIEVSDLHEMLDTPESFRKNFKDFRRWVLEKSHKDITNKTSLRFEYEPIKTGRKVTTIRFIFSKKRVLPVMKKKSDEAIEKQSRQNNKFFNIAMDCIKERGSACTGGHQTENICDICRRVR